MPEKVLEHICYEGRIMAEPFDEHAIRVSAHREGRKYAPSLNVLGPNGDYLPANPLEIPAALLRTTKETPAAALDCAFKALCFYLNNEVAAARLTDVMESSKHYVLLDDMGKRDYENMPAWDSEEMKTFQDEEFSYEPPNSEALREAGLMTLGSTHDVTTGETLDDASSMSGQAKGSEEDSLGTGPEGESAVDGNMAADAGLQNFLASTAGIDPELPATPGIGTGKQG